MQPDAKAQASERAYLGRRTQPDPVSAVHLWVSHLTSPNCVTSPGKTGKIIPVSTVLCKWADGCKRTWHSAWPIKGIQYVTFLFAKSPPPPPILNTPPHTLHQWVNKRLALNYKQCVRESQVLLTPSPWPWQPLGGGIPGYFLSQGGDTILVWQILSWTHSQNSLRFLSWLMDNNAETMGVSNHSLLAKNFLYWLLELPVSVLLPSHPLVLGNY